MLATKEKEIVVIKANGEREAFNSFKLENSLLKVGASQATVDKIISKLKEELTDGMTTAQIYQRAFFLLRQLQKPIAVRYSLRRAVSDLGPTGFIFEKLVAEIFKAKGYTVKVDQIVKGSCTDHEMDVVAYTDDKLVMSEVKFHHQQGIKTDLKVALYVKARFDDLRKVQFNYAKPGQMLSEGWLITNTKFTKTAIGYAMCAGVGIIGWNYPSVGNLHDMIEEHDLHPITCLSSLTATEKKYFLDKGIIICKDLISNKELLRQTGFSEYQIKNILDETKGLFK